MKRFSILILTLCLCLTGCGKQTTEATAQIFAMDTVMEIAAYGSKAEEAVQETKGRIKALENQLSRTKADSNVSRVNHNGTTPTTGLTYGMRALLPAALEYRDATNGAFDITIAPVMDAWGFTTEERHVPAPDALAAAMALVDSEELSVDTELNELLKHVNSDEIQVQEEPSYSVTLGEGQAIDLGGIAKGYTSDLVEQTFRANGIESGKISLGGNVFVLGGKPDGSDWRGGIRDPQDENALAAVLTLRDAYAITSGGYERYFEENGKTYHHIIDPSTGYPADSGLLSVTVVAADNGPDWAGAGNGAMCDAFSTALFVMGEEQALDFWRNGGYDFDLVLVTEDGRVVITAGLADRLEEVKDSGYTYETVS